jgi:hypothetical protein
MVRPVGLHPSRDAACLSSERVQMKPAWITVGTIGGLAKKPSHQKAKIQK